MKILLLLIFFITASQVILACCPNEEPCSASNDIELKHLDQCSDETEEGNCGSCKCCSLLAFPSSVVVDIVMINTEDIFSFSENTLFNSFKPLINPPDTFLSF